MYIPLVMMAMCIGTVHAHDLEELDQKSSQHLSSATQDISNTEIDAVEQAALDAAQRLINNPNTTCVDIQRAFMNAAKDGFLKVIKLTFLHPKISTTYKLNAMGTAAGGGHLEVVKFFLADPEIRSTGTPLDNAANREQIEVLTYLLTHTNITPKDKGYALKCASENDRIKAMGLLLQEPDITPEHKGIALEYAARDKAINAATLLLQEPDITPEHKGIALGATAWNGQLEIAELLLTHTDIKPMYKERALKVAITYSHLPIIRAILEIPEGSNQIPDHILQSPQNPTGWLTRDMLNGIYMDAFDKNRTDIANLLRPYTPTKIKIRISTPLNMKITHMPHHNE